MKKRNIHEELVSCDSCGKKFYTFYDAWNLAVSFENRYKDKFCRACRIKKSEKDCDSAEFKNVHK